MLRNATLKIHPGFPHGMMATHADVINAEILGFLKG
jgi:non-heme chloroperoxidase